MSSYLRTLSDCQALIRKYEVLMPHCPGHYQNILSYCLHILMTSFRSTQVYSGGFLTSDDVLEWIALSQITIESDVQYLQRTTKLVNDRKYLPSGYLVAVQQRRANKILSPQMLAIVLQSQDPRLLTLDTSFINSSCDDNRPKYNLTCTEKENIPRISFGTREI